MSINTIDNPATDIQFYGTYKQKSDGRGQALCTNWRAVCCYHIVEDSTNTNGRTLYVLSDHKPLEIISVKHFHNHQRRSYRNAW